MQSKTHHARYSAMPFAKAHMIAPHPPAEPKVAWSWPQWQPLHERRRTARDEKRPRHVPVQHNCDGYFSLVSFVKYLSPPRRFTVICFSRSRR
jgi:hypothetical protein